MYESPIEMIVNEMTLNFGEQAEENCVKAVQSYGFNVNREELLKALEYDRDQYDRGFEDGYISGKKDSIPLDWIYSWLTKSVFIPAKNNLCGLPTELELRIYSTIMSMVDDWREENENE